jgi:hypothetical protein
MIYHRIGNKSNTIGATCGEGTVYPIGIHEFILFLSVPSDYPFVAFKPIIMLSFFQRNTIFSIQLCDSPPKQELWKILVCIIARSLVAYPFYIFYLFHSNRLVHSKYTVHLPLHNSSRRGQNRMVDTFTSIYVITKVYSITSLSYMFSLQLITFVKLNIIFSSIFCSMSYSTKPYKTDCCYMYLFLFCLETSEIKA